jgi:putative ABC transport system permease protein
MRWWELFRQAIAGAARARLRSALTAVGIAIGCGALVSMIAFALGLQRQIEEPLKRLGMLNDIHVSQRGGRDGRGPRNRDDDGKDGDSKDDAEESKAPDTPATLDDEAIEKIRTLPGVKYAYPDLTLGDVDIKYGEKKTTVFAMALPREVGVADQFTSLLVAGSFFSLDDADEVVIAERMLDDLGFKDAAEAIGKDVEISAKGLAKGDAENQFEFQQSSRTTRIVGVVQPPGIDNMGGFGRGVLLPTDVMAEMPGLVESQISRLRRVGMEALGSYNSVTVRAENPSAVPRIAEAIRNDGFHARTMLSEMEDMRVAFLFIESLLSAVGSVALVIAGLGIANTLLMTVMERYEEIGLYKAIGATDGDIRLMFLAEAAVLGLVGSFLGLLLAAVVCWALQWGVNMFLASEGVKRPADVFYFPWWLLASGVGVSTLLSIVSGIYPAARAARVDPIKALRRA